MRWFSLKITPLEWRLWPLHGGTIQGYWVGFGPFQLWITEP